MDVAGEDVVDHVAGIPHVVEDPLIKQGVEAHPVVGDNQEAFQIEAHVVVDQEGRIAMLTRLFDEEEFALMIEVVDGLTTSE